MKNLVIVESPKKGRSIQDLLGDDYIVVASRGHIADLGKGGNFGIGIDIENNFKPRYVLMDDKVQVLNELMGLAKKCDKIYIASDPDREGESIAWHLWQRLEDCGKPMKRITFHLLTKKDLLKGIAEARDIDMNLFHAQEARRILDRIVGFMASPFLMNFWGNRLSAGRVQSVVTEMIIDREREIEAFVPEPYWTIQVNLSKDTTTGFKTKFSGKLLDEKTANKIKNELSGKNLDADYIVSSVISKEENKYPPPPMITSTLQRILSKKYGLTAERTMKAAQSLYESGYCSYIRTDSTRISEEALKELRTFIKTNNHDLPKKPYEYKNKDAAQDAHECIRPSDIMLAPENLTSFVDPDEKMVYEVIWKYYIASQMMPAVYNTLKVKAHVVGNTNAEVMAAGKALKYKGYLDILGGDDDSKIDIPNLIKGDKLVLFGKNPVLLEKKMTKPSPRFSEDTLIDELDKRNIGRPSTYAELLSKLTAKNYVENKNNVFYPTDLGKKITDILKQFFGFMDYNYTALLENQLDLVENGKLNYLDLLNNFYPVFKKELNMAYLTSGGSLCDKCNSPMVVRKTKDGKSSFLSCSTYPVCRNAKSIDIKIIKSVA